MNLRIVITNALFLFSLHLNCIFSQIIAEIDVPQLQLLAANLKPEECVRLVFLDSHSQLSDVQIQKLTREQSCFRRLVKWICQLRTVTRNTYAIVNNFLERIGRRDLIACLAEFNMKSSRAPKVIRNVEPTDYFEDYEGITVTTSKPKDLQVTKTTNQYSNQTIEKISGQTTIKMSLRTVGIILVTIVLLTCCCTLFIRNRLAHLWNKIRGKKKKGKLIPIGTEDISRSYFVRKPHTKRKRPSYELVHAATQNNIVAVPKEPEEPPPTGCYKCYKKKRKKSAKRPHR
ncbi:uncharacterized protein LOC114871016 [Osmia bicornis bicornis]|uniref:uncharacterized protein LOC114871016 n=1 Tax=Osmia bicornis bicornis TaxID=1437191 RepID=UPI0010F4F92D|nr:uncharacterized protein LOC114871016 [Osmia bicornis bicornis]XP_046141616.1 uncharacterized protein LOC114871016 [Osmia bicornis bicornis]